jgi:hypothetical protein
VLRYLLVAQRTVKVGNARDAREILGWCDDQGTSLRALSALNTRHCARHISLRLPRHECSADLVLDQQDETRVIRARCLTRTLEYDFDISFARWWNHAV